MTTTATFVGFDESNKVSSRVLKPPGGECSISFGGDDEDYRPKKTSVSAAPAQAPPTDAPSTPSAPESAPSSPESAPASPEKANGSVSSESNTEVVVKSEVSSSSTVTEQVSEKLEKVTISNGETNGDSFPKVEFKEGNPSVERSVSTENSKERLFGSTDAGCKAAKSTPSNHHMRSSIFSQDQEVEKKESRNAPVAQAPPSIPTRVRQPPGGFSTKLW